MVKQTAGRFCCAPMAGAGIRSGGRRSGRWTPARNAPPSGASRWRPPNTRSCPEGEAKLFLCLPMPSMWSRRQSTLQPAGKPLTEVCFLFREELKRYKRRCGAPQGICFLLLSQFRIRANTYILKRIAPWLQLAHRAVRQGKGRGRGHSNAHCRRVPICAPR